MTMKTTISWLGGLAAGLAIGLGAALLLRPVDVEASATQGEAGFIVCTAELEEGVEGIYYLDSQTGDLKGAFMNPRTGKLLSAYEYNILKDFKDAAAPKFLMVSGCAAISPNGNINASMGQIYVVDAKTGIFNIYAAPYGVNRLSGGATAEHVQLVRLDGGKFRSDKVRSAR